MSTASYKSLAGPHNQAPNSRKNRPPTTDYARRPV